MNMTGAQMDYKALVEERDRLKDDLRRMSNIASDVGRSRDRLQEKCDKLEWMLNEAMIDAGGYYPADALERRWKEANQ